MKLITTVVATAILLSTGLTYGQDEPGPNYEHLKAMEWAVGHWVHESELQEDVGQRAKKGEVFRQELTIEWSLQKNVLECREVDSFGGRIVLEQEYAVGWDAEHQTLCLTGYDRGGGRFEGTVAIDGPDAFVESCRSFFSSPERKVIKTYKIVMKRVDATTITRQRTQIKNNDGERADWALIELKRKT